MYNGRQAGTVSFGSIVGPAAGHAVAERASVMPRRAMNNAAMMDGTILTVPVILALGVLVWYALKNYG